MKYKKAWRTAAPQFEASTMLKFLEVKCVTGIKWENNRPFLLKKEVEHNFIIALPQIFQ